MTLDTRECRPAALPGDSGGEEQGTSCCGCLSTGASVNMLEKGMADGEAEDIACCGAAPAPTSQWERPGYQICGYVREVTSTPVGPVPVLSRKMRVADRAGLLRTRIGIRRNDYRVPPGLYALGNPGRDSDILVTAGYKLTVDLLRRTLKSEDVWVLILDTQGINVWCAAGKGRFCADEIVRRVTESGIERLVAHRRLILPQLAAPGVSAEEVRKRCGFAVVWGPVRMSDVPAFLENGYQADEKMRAVDFPLVERLLLAPVEIFLMWKQIVLALPVLLLISGIGPEIFSPEAAVNRGITAFWFGLAGIFSGALITPALLPWLPGPAFSRKGAISGIAAGMIILFAFRPDIGPLEALALLFWTTVLSSWTAMNFTGSTPFTSPTGVETEMRLAIPIQAALSGAGLFLWLLAPFWR